MDSKTHYEIDRDQKKIMVTRNFNAPVPKVWKAWTTSAALDKWWAPKPWRAETKSMDFSEGGSWLYAMVGPNNERQWSGMDYTKIDAPNRFEGNDYFCDEEGSKSKDMGSMHWVNVFSVDGDHTVVHITISFKSVEDLDKIIATGFKEGFAMGHDNLDAYLAEHH